MGSLNDDKPKSLGRSFIQNIRPITLVYTFIFFSVILVWDSFSKDFDVKTSYIDVLQLVLVTEVGFYFTSKGFEKVTGIKTKNMNENTLKENSKKDI